jgi:hypothetical protein
MTEQTIAVRRIYEPFKFLGRFFWVPLRVEPGTPGFSLTVTWEESGEYFGPTAVVRIPLTKVAIGVGVWFDPPTDIQAVHDEDAAFDAYVAVNGAVDKDSWRLARRKIAEQGLDPDEEMELMQAMGVFE